MPAHTGVYLSKPARCLLRSMPSAPSRRPARYPNGVDGQILDFRPAEHSRLEMLAAARWSVTFTHENSLSAADPLSVSRSVHLHGVVDMAVCLLISEPPISNSPTAPVVLSSTSFVITLGWGYMWEYPIARAFADARVQPIYGGSNEIMKELIARSLPLNK